MSTTDSAQISKASDLELRLRSRVASGTEPGSVSEKTVHWDPAKTAAIVCDMWDRHWCEDATDRVGELAPFMEGVLSEVRDRGVFIVHSPSDTLDFYEGYPQRRLAEAISGGEIPWGTRGPNEPPLPIDDSDGGCANEGNGFWKAWTRQHPAITIGTDDAISDDGAQVYGLFQARGIENVILMGVHTNMCVLGRSFGLRRLVEAGYSTVFVRDLTDSMYNPARAPYVSHFRGTELVVEHIERYICPTIDSTDLTGKPPFRFRESINDD